MGELLDKLEKPIEKFSDNPGLPANDAAKARAKKDSKRKANKVPAGTAIRYTRNGPKILKVTITTLRTERQYIGSLNIKKNVDSLKAKLKAWQDAKIWINEDDYTEEVARLRMLLTP
jgi:hypothetical protein